MVEEKEDTRVLFCLIAEIHTHLYNSITRIIKHRLCCTHIHQKYVYKLVLSWEYAGTFTMGNNIIEKENVLTITITVHAPLLISRQIQ